MRDLIKFFAWRIRRDEIGLEAAALAFTSVLALVPALTIVVSIFAMVPAFTPLKEEMMRFASENFLPVFTDAIGDSISSFVSHAASMTLTGALMLFVVSLMLIRSIDRSLNRIWRGGKRRMAMTFAIYWTMLTVGPLSFGITVWVTTKVIASSLMESMELEVAMRSLYFILPFFIEAAMIFVLYMVMPVTIVKWQDALVGAVLVAIAFEIAKRAFATFILNFSDYQAIYGAVAAAPVLMIWIYINWWLILIGAEFTSVLGVVRGGNADQVPKLIASLVNLLSAKDPEPQVVGSERVFSPYTSGTRRDEIPDNYYVATQQQAPTKGVNVSGAGSAGANDFVSAGRSSGTADKGGLSKIGGLRQKLFKRDHAAGSADGGSVAGNGGEGKPQKSIRVHITPTRRDSESKED